MLDRPELKDEPWRPIAPARLQTTRGPDELFAEIRRAGRLRAPPVRVRSPTRVERFIDVGVHRPGGAVR